MERDDSDCITLTKNETGTWDHLADKPAGSDRGVEQRKTFTAKDSPTTPKKEHLVYKRNELIDGRFKMSAISQKSFAALVSKVDPEADVLPDFEMTITEFAKLIGVSRQRVHKAIEKITNELQSQVARLPLRKEGKVVKNKRSFEKVSWFERSSYDDDEGLIRFVFSPDMKPYLQDFASNFTKYQLKHILALEGAYSIRLYELLRKLHSLKNVADGIFEVHRNVDYEDLREMLALGSKYPQFSQFKEHILDRAKRELNDTDLSFTYSLPDRPTPKSRAKVKIILFHITAKISRMKATGTIESVDLLDSLAIYLPPAAAVKMIEQYGESRCAANLGLLIGKIEDEGFKPNNVRGWLTKAIKFDYYGTKGALNPYTYRDPIQQEFVKEKLLAIWDVLTEDVKQEFLDHGFHKGMIAAMYGHYKSDTGQRSVTESLMDINDTSWGDGI